METSRLEHIAINIFRFSLKIAIAALKLAKNIAHSLARKIISNLQIIGMILCFIGTLVIVIDRFSPVHHFIDNHTKWHHVNLAVEDIQNFDYKTSDGEFVGYVGKSDPGFVELLEIVKNNRQDMKKKEIVGIAMNRIATFGGIPYRIVHAKLKNEPKVLPLTTEYIFYEWIRNFREKYFLKKGITLIAIGFLCGVLGQIIVRKKGGKIGNIV